MKYYNSNLWTYQEPQLAETLAQTLARLASHHSFENLTEPNSTIEVSFFTCSVILSGLGFFFTFLAVILPNSHYLNQRSCEGEILFQCKSFNRLDFVFISRRVYPFCTHSYTKGGFGSSRVYTIQWDVWDGKNQSNPGKICLDFIFTLTGFPNGEYRYVQTYSIPLASVEQCWSCSVPLRLSTVI